MSNELFGDVAECSNAQGPRMTTEDIASVQAGLLDRLQLAPFLDPFMDFTFPADDANPEQAAKSPPKILKSESGDEYSATVEVSTSPGVKQHSLSTLRVLHALVEYWTLVDEPEGEIRIHIVDLANCVGIDSESIGALGGLRDELEGLFSASLAVNPRPNCSARTRWLNALEIRSEKRGEPESIKTSQIEYALNPNVLAY